MQHPPREAEEEGAGAAGLGRELAASAQKIMGAVQKRIDHFASRYTKRGGNIACHEGCSTCCSISVRITLPEAVLLLPSVGERWATIRAKAEALFHLAVVSRHETEFLLRHRELVGPCPLLAADGACSVHPVRPLGCRGLLSTVPGRYCDDGYLGELREGSPAEYAAYLKQLDPRVNEIRLATPGGPPRWASHVIKPVFDLAREERAALLGLMLDKLGFCVEGQLPLMLLIAADPALMGLCEARDREGFVAGLPAIPGYEARLVEVWA
jgi:Fe-S-cluster containining protein